MKDVVYSSNYTDVNGTIRLLNRHVVNNMKDVYMIHIPMNELIFGSYKFVYLAREDLLHYCGMVEIDYIFRWMSHVIDLRENCVYVLDSLRSKVNEDIHGVINVTIWKCGKVCWYFRCWILCIVGVYYWFAMEGSMRCLICVIIYIGGYIGRFVVVGLMGVKYSFLY
ncbi:hypothetical protein IC575_002203 [Cucumis melo]